MKKSIVAQVFLGVLLLAFAMLIIPIKANAATTWNVERKLTQNTTVDGDLYVTGNLDLNGYKLTVNGNLIASADITARDYGKIVVNGNFIMKSGSLNIDYASATVDVKGNLGIHGLDSEGNVVKGSAWVYVTDGSIINVEGDFIWNTSKYLYNSISLGARGYEGTWSIKGDFINVTGEDFEWAVIQFNGNSQQIVDSEGQLGFLSGSNDNIKVNKYFSGTLEKSFNIKTDSQTLYINNKLDINGKSLTLPKTTVASADVYIGSYGKLIVKGDYIQTSKGLHIDYASATLEVEKNFCLYGIDSEGKEVQGSANISVTNGSVFNISGDYILNTSGYIWNSSSLGSKGYEGTYNLKGDLINVSGEDLEYSIINFNGNKQQIIDSEGPLGYISGSNNNIKVKKYFNGNLDKNLEIKSDGEIIINRQLGLNGYTLTTTAKTIIDITDGGGVYFSENGKMAVKSDLILKQGNLDMESSSTLDVTGNFNVIGLDANGNEVKGIGKLFATDGAILNIGKNFIFNSNGSNGSKAVFNVKGNFTDSIGTTWNTVNLVGDVNSNYKQTVRVASGGKITKLTLKSCPCFYDIPSSCYSSLVFEHKWDKGVITKEPTTEKEGIRTYTCTVCGEKYTEIVPCIATDPEAMVKAFVGRFYTIILGREGDEAGLNDWTNKLLSGEKTGADVAKGFILSKEFTNKGLSNDEFVKKLYLAFFDREADEGGYNGWMKKLNEGYTREYVLAGFVNSQEFKNLCAKYEINPGKLEVSGQTQQPQQQNQQNQQNQQTNQRPPLKLDASGVNESQLDDYVERLYQKALGRPSDEEGKTYWKKCIIDGQDQNGKTYDAATAARVGFFESKEYKNKGKNDDEFLVDLYWAFFNREPDADGYAYWQNKMKNEGYTRQRVIDEGFGHSKEFKNLLTSYGFKIIE